MIVALLGAVDFMNFTYATNPCWANVPVAAVMRRGSFSYFDPKMAAGFDLHVDSVKEGSLQAGTRQAVVVLACDYPVGGTAAAYVFAERNAGAVFLAQVAVANWGADWGSGPSSIHVRFANQRLYVDQCDDTDCTKRAQTTYALRAGKLTKVAAPQNTAVPDTVFVERLTWTEVRDAVHAGKTTIILPAGGTEQSGPYVALGKHNRRVEVLSERIARALRNALVAPVIAYVPEGALHPAAAHMRFPGTISVPPGVFEATLEAAADSFRVHGFKDVVLLGDHGGYQANLAAVAERLNRRWASTPARAHFIAGYYRTGGGHADLDDTSLMLAVDPSMVRLQALRSAPQPVAADGVYGTDPRAASAERGRALADAQVTAAVQAIRRATAPRASRL